MHPMVKIPFLKDLNLDVTERSSALTIKPLGQKNSIRRSVQSSPVGHRPGQSDQGESKK